MNVVWCILLLLSYFAFIYYIIKGGSMFVGYMVMAVLWAGVAMAAGALTPTVFLEEILQAPLSQGNTIVTMFFGSWFGMMLMESGIAQTIVRKAVELGGDKAVFTNILLCIVTCLIFTSCFGAGAVMGIGVIVLPILMSLGIPKPVALCSFIISVGAGMFVNPTIQMQLVESQLAVRGMEGSFDYHQLMTNGIVALVVQLVVVIAMVIILMKRHEKASGQAVKAWAVKSENTEEKMTPALSFLAPIIPIFMIAFFNWQPIAAFLLAAVYILLTCGRIKRFKDLERIMTKSFSDGVIGLAPMMGFLLCQGIFIQSASSASSIINSVIGGIFPKSYLFICVLFIVLMPLALFRGPLTLMGTGTIVLSILLEMGFAPQYVLTAMLFLGIGITISCCPTQSWSVWGMGYASVSTKDFMKTGVPWAMAATAINMLVVYFMSGIGA